VLRTKGEPRQLLSTRLLVITNRLSAPAPGCGRLADFKGSFAEAITSAIGQWLCRPLDSSDAAARTRAPLDRVRP